MGTRSLTRIKQENGTEIACIYQQFDGYPSGVGRVLQAFVDGGKLINGISGAPALGERFNGVGCFAAQLVHHLKDRVGGVYLYPPGAKDCGEEYVYSIQEKDGALVVTVDDGDGEKALSSVLEAAKAGA